MSQTPSQREWSDNDWVTLSALQHYSYCPRQYTLIFKDGIFDENYFTMHGRLLHERVDNAGDTNQDGVNTIRSLNVWSDRYGLIGKCDVVELHDGIPYPVEYKHGQLKKHSIHDEIQLCAQALCLEEMFHIEIQYGAIYQISSRHRREVAFTRELRDHVLYLAEQIRAINDTDLQPAENDERCPNCSLIAACMPTVNDKRREEASWLEKLPKEGFNI